MKDLIPAKDMTVIYGRPKSGKSFVALDIGWHVATGTPYHGKEVVQGPVIYMPFEGHSAIPIRAYALNKEKGPAPDLHIPKRHPPKVTIKETRAVIKEIQAYGIDPVLIILDTLNRSLVGSENDDEAMGPYVDQMQKLVSEFNCAVLIVHHQGHQDGRPRGHSLLPAAIGCQIKVMKEGKIIDAEVEFMKDGPEGMMFRNIMHVKEYTFTLKDGREIERSTCILEATTPGIKRKVKRTGLSSVQTKALDIARAMHNGTGGALSMKDWEERCTRKQGGIAGEKVSFENSKKMFRRAVGVLLDGAYIVYADDMRETFRLNEVTQ